MRRIAGDTGFRKVRGSGSELDAIDIESETIRGDLIQRSASALAHLVRPDLHDAAAVLTQHRVGMAFEHQRRKCRRADAPADQQSITVAYLPRRERAARPAQTSGALPVA